MSDDSSFSAIKTQRVTDTVYQQLREKIVARALPPGHKINVDEVARQIDVSRTPVHEALALLAADGLVEVRPRRGTFVTEFGPRDYAETLDVRRALEMLAAETICDHARQDDVRELEALIEDMERVVQEAENEAEAARRHHTMNLEFHLRLVNLSSNQRLVAMYEDLRAHLRIARVHVDAREWLSRLSMETREHEVIVCAIKDGDADRLKNALDTHLRRSAASLIDDVTRNEGREASNPT